MSTYLFLVLIATRFLSMVSYFNCISSRFLLLI
jgi:hypothetical protein